VWEWGQHTSSDVDSPGELGAGDRTKVDEGGGRRLVTGEDAEERDEILKLPVKDNTYLYLRVKKSGVRSVGIPYVITHILTKK
jgi:hypothetical protein